MSRAEMKNSGREAKRAVCYKLQGENRKGGLGWIPGETRAEARIGGSGSSSSSRGLHSTALGGCTAVSGLLSTGTGGLSAFSGLSPEANGFHPQGDHFTLPWSSSSSCHWSVGHTQTLISVRFPRVPSVTFHVGCPGANPWDCSCRPDSIPGHSRAGLSWWCDCTSGDHNELAVFQWLLKSLD